MLMCSVCDYDVRSNTIYAMRVLLPLSANFSLLCDNAAKHMPDYVMYDYIKFSDSGCQSDHVLFEAHLTCMHET